MNKLVRKLLKTSAVLMVGLFADATMTVTNASNAELTNAEDTSFEIARISMYSASEFVTASEFITQNLDYWKGIEDRHSSYTKALDDQLRILLNKAKNCPETEVSRKSKIESQIEETNRMLYKNYPEINYYERMVTLWNELNQYLSHSEFTVAQAKLSSEETFSGERLTKELQIIIDILLKEQEIFPQSEFYEDQIQLLADEISSIAERSDSDTASHRRNDGAKPTPETPLMMLSMPAAASATGCDTARREQEKAHQDMLLRERNRLAVVSQQEAEEKTSATASKPKRKITTTKAKVLRKA